MKRIALLTIALLSACGGSPPCFTVTDTNRNHVIHGRAFDVLGNALLYGSQIDIGNDNQSVVTTLFSANKDGPWSPYGCPEGLK